MIAMLEAPTLVACLNNVAMMCQPINYCSSHSGVPEQLRPLTKIQIRGHQNLHLFIQLANLKIATAIAVLYMTLPA